MFYDSVVLWKRSYLTRTIKQIYKRNRSSNCFFLNRNSCKTDNTVRRTEPKVWPDLWTAYHVTNRSFCSENGEFDYDQLTLCFNEAEVTIETDCAEEPLIEEVIPAYKRVKRPKGKRDEDLSGLPVREEYHELSENSLSCSQMDIGDFQTGFIKTGFSSSNFRSDRASCRLL